MGHILLKLKPVYRYTWKDFSTQVNILVFFAYHMLESWPDSNREICAIETVELLLLLHFPKNILFLSMLPNYYFILHELIIVNILGGKQWSIFMRLNL